MYAPFLERLVRDLAEPLDFTQVRKLSSVLSTLANDKQRQERDSKKSGGKKGACVSCLYCLGVDGCSYGNAYV